MSGMPTYMMRIDPVGDRAATIPPGLDEARSGTFVDSPVFASL
jgi:hypothetical protein